MGMAEPWAAKSMRWLATQHRHPHLGQRLLAEPAAGLRTGAVRAEASGGGEQRHHEVDVSAIGGIGVAVCELADLVAGNSPLNGRHAVGSRGVDRVHRRGRYRPALLREAHRRAKSERG